MANKELLDVLQSKLDQLKSLSLNSSICDSSNLQDRIIKDLLNDAVQLIEGAFLVSNAQLGTPLFVLMRVLCELMFRIDWISLSSDNASEFEREVMSETVKLMSVNLERGRAKIVHKKTGEDYTNKVQDELKTLKQPRKKIEDIAKELGLSKVYDTIYRSSSLEVHMKTFGGPSSSEEDALYAGLAGIISISKVIILIAEKKVLSNKTTSADEIFKVLKLNIGGK